MFEPYRPQQNKCERITHELQNKKCEKITHELVKSESGTSCSGWPYTNGAIKVEPTIKPSRAKVEIEELDSNLLSGCRISHLEGSPVAKMEKVAAWHCVFYTVI